MSNPSDHQPSAAEQYYRQRRSVPFKFMVPLIYAPALPLVRIMFRKKPVLRQRLFFGIIGAAIMHGTYLLMFDLSLDSNNNAVTTGLPPPPSGLPSIPSSTDSNKDN